MCKSHSQGNAFYVIFKQITIAMTKPKDPWIAAY